MPWTMITALFIRYACSPPGRVSPSRRIPKPAREPHAYDSTVIASQEGRCNAISSFSFFSRTGRGAPRAQRDRSGGHHSRHRINADSGREETGFLVAEVLAGHVVVLEPQRTPARSVHLDGHQLNRSIRVLDRDRYRDGEDVVGAGDQQRRQDHL